VLVKQNNTVKQHRQKNKQTNNELKKKQKGKIANMTISQQTNTLGEKKTKTGDTL